ncbi:ABC1 kinase family protein [candidate division CSSED10-310 bacterium]|uniref:ABC1 kinase family protein n=1 Tax=candidate division CSSED10-310 bacterium TaxID=2855610 RepID=A0ABV6Z5T9_UNCC1
MGQKIKRLVVSPEKIADSLYQANVRNAERIAKTFGELKGAVMKVGQMISLQAGIFPEEFTSILSKLQQDSPPVDFELLENQITNELNGSLDVLFKEFDEKSHASASIGQVHRAVLPDGTQVVVKVQYPGVDAMVESDLKNLRMFFRSLGKYKLNMDVLELWAEIRERLDEELNYEHELQNIMLFRRLFQDDKRIIIPEPIPEYSSQHVLTMEYVPGLSWQEIIRDEFPSDLRNKLAVLLFETMLKQLFHFHILHADPNLSNFAFREDGSLIIYDFGCVKKFPRDFVQHYCHMVYDALHDDYQGTMSNFKKLGFSWTPEEAVDEDMVEYVAKVALRPYLADKPYDFSEADLHEDLLSFARDHLSDDVKFEIPPDILFLDRVVGGMYGNMMKLRALGNWKDILMTYLDVDQR